MKTGIIFCACLLAAGVCAQTRLTWRQVDPVTGGGSGAVAVRSWPAQNGLDIDIVRELVPTTGGANEFRGLNTFRLGLELAPTPLPLYPRVGRIVLDQADLKVKLWTGDGWREL